MEQNASTDRRHDVPASVDPTSPPHRLDRWLDSPPDKYFDELIKLASTSTNALAGQVWGLKETGRLVKVSSTDPVAFAQFDQPEIVNDHKNLISKALFEGQLTSNRYLQREGLTDVERTLVLAPFSLEQESIGVVELILPHEMDDQRLPVVNELLAHVSGYLFKRSQLQSASPENAAENRPVAQPQNAAADLPLVRETDQSVSTDPAGPVQARTRSDEIAANQRLSAVSLEHFVWQLHRHADLKYVSATAVNETRRLLECDRVCLAVRRGNATDVIAISGQDSIAKKSNTVHVIQEMAERAITAGRLIQFDGNEKSANRTDASLLAYLGETGSQRLRVIPLFADEKIDFESESRSPDQAAFAALLSSNSRRARDLILPSFNGFTTHLARDQPRFKPGANFSVADSPSALAAGSNNQN